MKKKITVLFAALLIAAAACVPALAADAETDSADNVFASGDTVTLPDSFFGGFAAGGQVDIEDSKAKGSVYAAGRQVTTYGAKIGESLFAAGETVIIKDTDVKGNIFVAANTASIEGDCSANGVYIAANTVTFEGKAKAFMAGGNKVIFNGRVDGDVEIDAEFVEIGEDAKVSGSLSVKSANEPDIADGADTGDYSFELQTDEADAAVSFGMKVLKKIVRCIYWIIAMSAFGMILCWLFSDHLTRATQFMKTRTGAMVASGIIGWMCIPLAVLIMFVTRILAPAGGLLLLAYIMLICAGLAFAGASLSRLVFPKMNVFLSALIGIAVLEAVRMIPVIGTLVGIAADMYLLAYVIQSLWIRRLKKAPAVTAADTLMNLLEERAEKTAEDSSPAEDIDPADAPND
ncbi:MAG: polymer-forming cytoskeletal protein [Lachnospiraceae bacterium]|nr:polymer-forming cytoskeletal protein [Lachnospiraceae bacterium]